jgi:tRNA A-37 threonylcarbamoyl transferase component Bud32
LTSFSVIVMSMAVFACSSGSDEPSQDHVFKGYENALEKAKQVQPQLDEAEQERRKKMEEMLQ